MASSGNELPDRHSIRIAGHDYTSPGAYFVTMVTCRRGCVFGSIVDGTAQPTAVGRIASDEWVRLPSRFPTLSLDAFVVMPNHVHGIILLSGPGLGLSEQGIDKPGRTHLEGFGKPVAGSIPTIIRSYKAAVALKLNRLRGTSPGPVWQRNYHERVIRTEAELDATRSYILENPSSWSADIENPACRQGPPRNP